MFYLFLTLLLYVQRERILHHERKGPRTSTVFFVGLWIAMLVVSVFLISVFTNMFLGRSVAQELASQDWAGYAVLSDLTNPQPVIESISGSWVVPVVQASEKDTFSAAWIGIGGQVDDTLIQTGTDQDCVSGQVTYSAWYELLPQYALVIETINVTAGDKITASISLVNSATDEWLIEINDVTSGQSFSKSVFYPSSRLSAECIVERPSVNNSVSTLANFGSVTFTDIRISINSNSGTVTDFPFSRVLMYNRQNAELASLSPLSSGGSSFTVNYISNPS
jgi:hypothetical protein